MSWSIQFAVEGGKLVDGTVSVSGSVPDGMMTLAGHDDGVGLSLSVAAAGINSSLYVKHSVMPVPKPAETADAVGTPDQEEEPSSPAVDSPETGGSTPPA